MKARTEALEVAGGGGWTGAGRGKPERGWRSAVGRQVFGGGRRERRGFEVVEAGGVGPEELIGKARKTGGRK